MTSRKKRYSFFVKRRGQLTLVAICSIIVVLLFLNDDTSVSRNMEYDHQITQMKAEIKANNDSAQYYRQRYEDLLSKKSDLEHVAREQFHMQRATEDVYCIKD